MSRRQSLKASDAGSPLPSFDGDEESNPSSPSPSTGLKVGIFTIFTGKAALPPVGEEESDRSTLPSAEGGVEESAITGRSAEFVSALSIREVGVAPDDEEVGVWLAELEGAEATLETTQDTTMDTCPPPPAPQSPPAAAWSPNATGMVGVVAEPPRTSPAVSDTA
eukprot:Hpha_TRINITY_DN32746_c0_g1::TRINITY_DN32746_c0_g1_i1::g.69265::m.69265